MKRLIAPLVLLAAVGVALALTAGGGRKTGDEQTSGSPVPAVSVARLGGDGQFALSQLAAARSPTLLWFWAPWREICNHEAPAIERLAADARGELAVVAIGGPDKAANGPAFVTRHRLRSPTVLFDEPTTAWQAYRIPAQPAAVAARPRRA
jgi:thiol-disulfide isomerase/thioredoxin